MLDSFKEIYSKGNGKIGKYHWKICTMKIIKYKVKQTIRQYILIYLLPKEDFIYLFLQIFHGILVSEKLLLSNQNILSK